MNLRLTSPRAQQELTPIPIHVILASQSVGRKMLLEKLGLRFRSVVARIEENDFNHPQPLVTIKKRAAAKLEEVINHPRVYVLDEKANNLIIAADSMAIVGKNTYGKANDREHARSIIKELMGKAHAFVTAVSIAYVEVDNKLKKRWDKVVTTKVHFRKMNTAEIESYVTRFDFSRFAAGYALNEAPWDLVTKIDGSYTNVIGLPFEILLPILRDLKIIT